MAFYDRFFAALRTRFDRSFEERLRRRLADATSFTIAEAHDHAFGRVIGVVRARGDTIEAPLSGRPCVAFRLIIEIAPGLLVERHQKLGLYNRGTEFDLVVGEHYAVIDSRVAIVITEVSHEEVAQRGRTVTPRQRAILDESGLTYSGNRGSDELIDFEVRHPGALRFYESIVAVGDTVAVLGGAVHESDPMQSPSSYRDIVTRPRFSGTPKLPLVIGGLP